MIDGFGGFCKSGLRKYHWDSDGIETRERLLDVESLLSGDKYVFVKDAYIQSIQYEVKDGIDIQDDFVEEMDDFLID